MVRNSVLGQEVCITCPEGATYGWLLSQLLRMGNDDEVEWNGLRTLDGVPLDLGAEIVPAVGVPRLVAVETSAGASAGADTDAGTAAADVAPVQAREAAAAMVTRCIRRAGTRSSMAAVVEAVRKRLAAMCQLLQQGFEVTKFSRGGVASKRVVWIGSDGMMCLSKSRRAKRDKAIRLEDISRVVQGVNNADNFARSAQFSTAIAGAEQCCISIYGGAGDVSFHFRLGDAPSANSTRSTTAARMLCELLQVMVRKLAIGTAAERRARAVEYARTGTLRMTPESS